MGEGAGEAIEGMGEDAVDKKTSVETAEVECEERSDVFESMTKSRSCAHGDRECRGEVDEDEDLQIS